MKYLYFSRLLSNRLIAILSKNFILFCVTVLALGLFTTNLSGQEFSLDEPYTVLVARSIGLFGFPSAWDGKQLSVTNIRDFTMIGPYFVWTWHPPIQHYLAYLGYVIGGETHAAFRLPFALCGVGTVLLSYGLGLSLFKNRLIALLLSLHVMLLVPFFLYSRQVRYYAPVSFFSLLQIFLLVRWKKTQWTSHKTFVFFLSSILLFLTNYLTWITSTAYLLLYGMLHKNKSQVISLLGSSIFAFVWWIFFTPFHGEPLTAYEKARNFLSPVITNASYLNSYIFPFTLLPFIFIVGRKEKLLCVLIGIICFKLLVYSYLLSPHGRFLIDLYVLCVILYGYLYSFLLRQKKYFLVISIFLISTLTNGMHIFPFYFIAPEKAQIGYTYSYYKFELSGSYSSLLTEVGLYLKKNYRIGDLFWSNNYMNWIYYYSDVPGISVLCDNKKGTFIGPPSVTDPEKIRWFVFFQDTSFNPPQTLRDVDCFGDEWQKKIEKDFTRKLITFPRGLYGINDADMVNRLFPPLPLRNTSIIVYERKGRD